MTHIMTIPTANLRHSATANSQEVYLSDSNNDRQPEVAAEPEILKFLKLQKIVKIPTTNLR